MWDYYSYVFFTFLKVRRSSREGNLDKTRELITVLAGELAFSFVWTYVPFFIVVNVVLAYECSGRNFLESPTFWVWYLGFSLIEFCPLSWMRKGVFKTSKNLLVRRYIKKV